MNSCKMTQMEQKSNLSIQNVKAILEIKMYNPCHAVYFYVLHSSLIFILLARRNPVLSMFLQSEGKHCQCGS